MTDKPWGVTTVFIAAVGGQGGALFTEWLLAAAHQMSYRAHAVGIPGMSQRGGATSYYVEMAPEESIPELADALLSPAPFAGEIDCLVGLELLELGRAVESGYSSDKTAVIGSTHRDFTILEKLPSYSGHWDEGEVMSMMKRCSESLLTFDARALARTEGLADRHVNAILLGAVAASKALPFREEAYRLAIKSVGVAPDLNLKAFESGLRHVLAGLPPLEAIGSGRLRDRTKVQETSNQGGGLPILREVPAQVNGDLRSILEVACERLIDYQDEDYARGYLQRVIEIWSRDNELPQYQGRLTKLYAKHTANLMTYEDPIRVATLKGDPRRLERIRAEHGIEDGQTFRLRERFQPEMEELYGLLPAKLVGLLRPSDKEPAGGKEKRPGRLTLPVNVKTTSLAGMLVLKVLERLKALRPYSWRRQKEERLLDSYTQTVFEFLDKSYELGCVIAQVGGMMRGYGKVRRRTIDLFHAYVEEFLRPIATLDERLDNGNDYTLTLRAQAAVQKTLKPTGEGFEEAVALAKAIQARSEDRPYGDLLEMVLEFSNSSVKPAL